MRTQRRTILAIVMAGSLAAVTAMAAEPPPGGTRPLLKQLNEETQSLYREIQSGVVRVQLPPPKWAGQPLVEQDNPLNKWGNQLDAGVKEQLELKQKDAQKGQVRKISATVGATAATQPATQSSGGPQSAKPGTVGAWTVSNSGDDVLILRPNGAGAGALQFDAGGGLTPDGQLVAGGGRLQVNVAPSGSFTPNNIGLLLDGQGHILVPICVEKESFDSEGVRVMVGPGQMAMAHFLGSDRQANITLLKLDKPLGTPVKLAAGRPQEGTLTMFLSPNSGVGRLMIWTNELKDWGVVVSMEGAIYGFARQGQFLSASGCKMAIDQLAKDGQVRRAKIGLGIAEVAQNDPARESDPVLGTQPAVRVSEIAANSAAAGAGLKVGDLILQLNDQPVGDPHSFAAAMSDPSAKTSVKLLRDGQEQTLTLEPAKDR
ncbi:MAG: trypsin-like serine protease with C-terminal domain [Phycisphaerales bacterium]|nr:trypsin-like serine protease with C-terminal domain [Phycisphaerales bacterium]